MSPSKLSFSPFAQPSPHLAHFSRLLATTSGQDKVFMILAYSSKVAAFLLSSPRLATKARLDLAARIAKIGAVIGDARVLYRLFGVFPIISWLQSLNSPASGPADKTLRTIQKLQGWSMVFYYPMENISYLASKGAWDLKPATVGALSIWSCRFWAAYVVLQLLHIRRSYTMVTDARQALATSRAQKLKSATAVTDSEVAAEKSQLQALRNQEAALKDDLWVQMGYLPLTVHWSLPNGLLPDQVYVGICGAVAAAFGLKGVWKATA